MIMESGWSLLECSNFDVTAHSQLVIVVLGSSTGRVRLFLTDSQLHVRGTLYVIILVIHVSCM